MEALKRHEKEGALSPGYLTGGTMNLKVLTAMLCISSAITVWASDFSGWSLSTLCLSAAVAITAWAK